MQLHRVISWAPALALLLVSAALPAGCANGGGGGTGRNGGPSPSSDTQPTVTDDAGLEDDGPGYGGTGDSGARADAPRGRCGFAGESCCASATPCSEGSCTDGICEVCGAPGEACCPGSACSSGAACADGTCETCGAPGQICCPGAACFGSAACVAGTCGGDPPTGGSPAPGSPAAVCTPGSAETTACGRCGVTTRYCGADGTWEAGSACTGEGECTPGDTDGLASCTAECRWGDYTTCAVAPGCPAGWHIAAILCDGRCSGACSGGYNAISCVRDTPRFTTCVRCPGGFAPVSGACDPACLFPCTDGMNALVCESS